MAGEGAHLGRHHLALGELRLLDVGHLVLRRERDLLDARKPAVRVLQLRRLGRLHLPYQVRRCRVEAVLVFVERRAARRALALAALFLHLLLDVPKHVRVHLTAIRLRSKRVLQPVVLPIVRVVRTRVVSVAGSTVTFTSFACAGAAAAALSLSR